MLNLLQDAADINDNLYKRKDKCAKLGLTAQPIVVVVSPRPDLVESSAVYVDSTAYSIRGVLRTVDVCFKIHMALNAAYSTESKQVLLFMQRYFYKIKTDSDKVTSSITNLMGQLSI